MWIIGSLNQKEEKDPYREWWEKENCEKNDSFRKLRQLETSWRAHLKVRRLQVSELQGWKTNELVLQHVKFCWLLSTHSSIIPLQLLTVSIVRCSPPLQFHLWQWRWISPGKGSEKLCWPDLQKSSLPMTEVKLGKLNFRNYESHFLRPFRRWRALSFRNESTIGSAG